MKSCSYCGTAQDLAPGRYACRSCVSRRQGERRNDRRRRDRNSELAVLDIARRVCPDFTGSDMALASRIALDHCLGESWAPTGGT